MPTTANYSWPTPADTDLVKNGADAMRDLGDAIDTTVKSVSDGRGLVHINTTSFSAVASQSINDVFSATYDVYEIICNITGSTTSRIDLRVRVGGTDLSGGVYQLQTAGVSSATYTAQRDTNQTQIQIGTARTTIKTSYTKISNPFATTVTSIVSTDADYSGGSVTSPAIAWNYGAINNTTSYTGFTILAASGTFTGSISVFGYRKS